MITDQGGGRLEFQCRVAEGTLVADLFFAGQRGHLQDTPSEVNAPGRARSLNRSR